MCTSCRVPFFDFSKGRILPNFSISIFGVKFNLDIYIFFQKKLMSRTKI